MTVMRAVVVYLTLLLLLVLSLGAGFLASDWPRWCSQWHLCVAAGRLTCCSNKQASQTGKIPVWQPIMSTPPYTQLEQEWRRLHAFQGALALLRWDAAVMMPRGSSDVRGEQLAALETETHALLTAQDHPLARSAQANAAGLEDWQLANLREMRRARDHAIATPVSLITRLARATSRAEVHWSEARRENNFEIFAPHLEESCCWCETRQRCWAGPRPSSLRPLVDEFSPGMATADIERYSRRCRAACRR